MPGIMKDYLPIVLSLTTAVVWVGFWVLLLRRYLKAPAHTFSFYVFLVGMIGWGASMFLANLIYDEMAWRLWSDSNRRITIEKCLEYFLLYCVGGGGTFGFLDWLLHTSA